MKLELKHLATYLPYGLMIHSEYYQITAEIIGLQNNSIITGFYENNGNSFDEFDYNEKPILIPLSRFDNWVIKDIKKELGISHNQCMEFLGFSDGEIQLENISYGLYVALCKNLIDFQKLIPKGLAIDINTLK